MSEDGDVPSRKGRDPILMIGAIVLALAFAVVISNYAYGELAPASNEPAGYGNAVNVNYVGSYYGYYIDDKGNVNDDAVIFDTSLWAVAKFFEDDAGKYNFSWEFTKKTENQCVPFKVTIGSGGALADFENVLIGMKPGDTARVFIKDAYGEVSPAKEKTWNKTLNFSIMETMSVDAYKTMFALDVVYPGPQPVMKHPYGWTSSAFCGSDGIVTVTHDVTDKTYENVDGSIKTTVTTTSPTTFKIDLDFPKNDGKLIEFKYGGQKYYVTGVGATTFNTKSTDERTGMDMFFVITFVAYA
jgi:FKBP-type peptidyl-prolyl cis-trans isomerase 2